jgi:hypothetical protein
LKLLIEQNRISIRRTSFLEENSGSNQDNKQNNTKNGDKQASNRMFDSDIKKKSIDDPSDDSMEEEDAEGVDPKELKRRKYLKTRGVIL